MPIPYIMQKLRNTTLLFLVKKSGATVAEICLGMKKRGFGVGRWNGVGGKVNGDLETIGEAAIRETREEIGVSVRNMQKVAELSFFFPHKPEWNQKVHTYLCASWSGSPRESEEMKPQWFSVQEIPFTSMWPDDPFWLPRVLSGEILRAEFTFDENDNILSHAVVSVPRL